MTYHNPPLPVVINMTELRKRWEKWKHFSFKRKHSFTQNHINDIKSKRNKYLHYYQNGFY